MRGGARVPAGQFTRKKPRVCINVDSSDECEEQSFEENSQPFNESQSDDNAVDYQQASDVELDEFKRAAYKQVLKEDRQPEPTKRQKDVFTRFSVRNFSTIISGLTPYESKVIEEFGFGSLLLFDRCFVPNKFAQWVARLVNYRSKDIVVNNKVISLTRESVNLILGVPMTDKPFPHDYSVGKSVILSKFEKNSIPPVSFFFDRLSAHIPMSDEDIFICFIMVAISSFLCPNASRVPSFKYFGIFEDISNAKLLDWSGYVLDWLVEGIKGFTSSKSSRDSDGGTLPGCLYYLAVLYLDHVDFGARQVPDAIPRISVWKGDMLREYSDYDLKSSGCYGYHPLVDTSRTCYSKDARYLYNPSSLSLNDDFKDKLEAAAGGKLSDHVKTNICNIMSNFCFNAGVSINLDLQVVHSLPDEFKATFCKLLQHAYSVDSRVLKLVLDVTKIYSEYANCDDENSPPGSSHEEEEVRHANMSDRTGNQDNIGDVYCSQYELCRIVNRRIFGQSINVPKGRSSNDEIKESSVLPSPNLSCPSKNITTPITKRSSPVVVPPPSGYPPNHRFYQSFSQRDGSSSSKVHDSRNNNLRAPLTDCTNDASLKQLKKTVSFSAKDSAPDDDNIILLDNSQVPSFVPDSVSPSPIHPSSRVDSAKAHFGKENVPTSSGSKSPIRCENLNFTSARTPNSILKTSLVNAAVSAKIKSQAQRSHDNQQTKVCPEIQILAERTLADNVREMGKKSDEIYNANLASGSNTQTPFAPSTKRNQFDITSQTQPYIIRDSSTGGKAPRHGPRRFVRPIIRDDFVSSVRKRFYVSNDEIQSYDIICKLALSEYQCEDAVNIHGVRCTYWSIGESLKPGGYVKPYVVSAFCYTLFQRTNGHPDASKRHYFFSNIGENLLKEINEADDDVVGRAFKISSRARPLYCSNLLFFPTCFEEHWFVFVVDIKDRKFVMLDPLYKETDAFQKVVREKMKSSFQHFWDKFVHLDMGFDHYGFAHPVVPQLHPDNECDSGIYAMMFMEHWVSPRTLLTSVFNSEDIPNIRIKIANELMFQPKNNGMKQRVFEFKE